MPPLSLVVDLLLQLVLPAAVIAAGLMVAAYFAFGPHSLPHVAPLVVASGIAVGNWRRPLLDWYPASFGYDALLGVAAILLLTGLLAEILRSRSALAANYVLPLLGATAVAWCVLPTDLRTPLWFIGATALFAGVWLVIQQRAADHKPPGVAIAALSIGLAAATSLLMLLLNSARLADLALLPASALVAVAATSWFCKIEATSLLPLAAVYWPSQILATADYHDYEYLPLASYFLLAVAPLCLAPMLLPQAQRLPVWSRNLVDLALLAAPLVVAVFLMLTYGELSFE
jgi:hypothetical protein